MPMHGAAQGLDLIALDELGARASRACSAASAPPAAGGWSGRLATTARRRHLRPPPAALTRSVPPWSRIWLPQRRPARGGRRRRRRPDPRPSSLTVSDEPVAAGHLQRTPTRHGPACLAALTSASRATFTSASPPDGAAPARAAAARSSTCRRDRDRELVLDARDHRGQPRADVGGGRRRESLWIDGPDRRVAADQQCRARGRSRPPVRPRRRPRASSSSSDSCAAKRIWATSSWRSSAIRWRSCSRATSARCCW